MVRQMPGLLGRCHRKISTPIFWYPRATNPRIFGTPIPIFLGLCDPHLQPPSGKLESPQTDNHTTNAQYECFTVPGVFAGMLRRTKTVSLVR